LKKPLYFPGLNGLRAIAATGILLLHITGGLFDFGLKPDIFLDSVHGNANIVFLQRLAAYCVSMFFSISGFVIAYLLLEEKKTGDINVKKFYVRRMLRLWPLYFLYILLTIITNYIFDISYNKSQLFFYIFLMSNIPFAFGNAILLVSHFWTLGVEQQFYLFIPNWVKRIKHLFTCTVLLFGIFMLLKMSFKLLAAQPICAKLYFFLNTSRYQCLLIGVIFAILYYNKNALFLKITTHIFTQIFAWLILVLVFTDSFRFPYFLIQEIVTTATCIIIIAQVMEKNRIINLENKIFNFLGKISYGIYVVHPLITLYVSKIIHFDSEKFINYIIVYGLCVAATLVVSYLSHEYFEKWFLKLKINYITVKSRDS
jgi:peptidoglycan/LPS O-acetylase OafA/YrhL